MIRRVASWVIAFAPLVACAQSAPTAQSPAPAASPKAEEGLPSVAAKTKNLQKLDGYLPLYWDARQGKLLLEISRWNEELLFVASLATGVGSSDIGLDRGEVGDERVVVFERIGPRVLLRQKSTARRMSKDSPAERAAVAESFPTSVLWGSTVVAEDAGGPALVDATDLFSSDAHDVALTLKVTKQGRYELEPSRSSVSIATTRNFPENTEVESLLTFVNKDPNPEKDDPGQAISDSSPHARTVTLRAHYSLVKLPDAGYTPRAYDPRSGYFEIAFEDYGAEVSSPLLQRLIVRHRLVKKDPRAEVSEPVKPIVYYVDPGIPEPLRTAVIQGASLWNDAFLAAGFRNALRVEPLPPGVDPMDVRYHQIEWVHRATRGWSTGRSIVDPRTGEIIQGHVLLGSKRARQDFLIFEGLLAPYAQGSATDPRLMAMVLARLRQLAAHEVGHTLGLRHNYQASVADRASVMDYPPPRITLNPDGTFHVEDAYAPGLGKWDVAAVKWGYSAFASPADEKRGLESIMSATLASGLGYLTDEDSRASGSAVPEASLWDDGTNAIDQLAVVMRVRAKALERFGEDNVAPGTPLAQLENVLVPLYLHHRYQLEAATRMIGGVRYRYAMRGDRQAAPEAVPADDQRRALAAVLATIAPSALVLPARVVKLIPPPAPSYDRTRESFAGHTGAPFDPLAPAEAAAQLTLSTLLDPARAARLLQARARDPRQLGLSEVVDQVWLSTWKAPAGSPEVVGVHRAVDAIALATVMELVTSTTTASGVRALAFGKLQELRDWATARLARTTDAEERAHLLFAIAQIRRLEIVPGETLKPSPPPTVPPGAPIGSLEEE